MQMNLPCSRTHEKKETLNCRHKIDLRGRETFKNRSSKIREKRNRKCQLRHYLNPGSFVNVAAVLWAPFRRSFPSILQDASVKKKEKAVISLPNVFPSELFFRVIYLGGEREKGLSSKWDNDAKQTERERKNFSLLGYDSTPPHS